MPSPQARPTTTTAAFDAIQEYCAQADAFLWQPPACFLKWTSSGFTIDGVSLSCSEQCFTSENRGLYGELHGLQNIMRVCDPKLHKQNGRAVPIFDAIVWKHKGENIVLGSYATLA